MSALRTLLVLLFLAPYSVLASILGYALARLLGSPAVLYVLGLVHYCLRYAGFIDVDRRDPGQSRLAMTRAVASLKGGNCFIIFPEGTRSLDGKLGEFKKGGFVVAIEAGSRIAPVAVMGAETLMPRGRFVIQPGTVRIRVLDPVDAASYSYEDRDRLVAEVRGRIAAALPA
jgi:1-acyl-sn-glycerol-3-phosphate acyltransferase